MGDKKIRGGALVARALKDKGIDNVFTLSGGFCNPALEGFMECQINVINCPHEQIAGHLADGHTRISRKPSVCIVGPEGFANAVPSMMEAWGERSPVIFITGSSSLKRQGAGGFKEIDDVSIAAPLTKYSASITDGNRIREFVDKAYRIATNGYPGAVHLSVPVDIMFSSFADDAGLEERPFTHQKKPLAKAWPDPESLNEIFDLFGKDSRDYFNLLRVKPYYRFVFSDKSFFVTRGLKITKRETIFEKNYWKINASHDGYQKKYNTIHERNIEFYPGEETFVGCDKILKKINKNYKFDIRFHVEPDVKLMKTQDGKSILIELEDEGWKFTCDNYDINIDNGLYFGNKNSYIDNQNIFISGISNNQTEDIKWQIKKI